MRLLFLFLLMLPVAAAEFQPRVVNTMAELLELQPLDSRPMVQTLGYYTPGDGGGGIYVLTNTVAGTNAYGGRVLTLKGTNSWELVDSHNVNVHQFGVVADNVSACTNNVLQILAAVNFVKNSGGVVTLGYPGQTVWWGNTDTVLVSNNCQNLNVKLNGSRQSRATVTNRHNYFFRFRPAGTIGNFTNCVFENITFEGPGTFDGGGTNCSTAAADDYGRQHVLEFQGIRNLVVDNLTITNASKYAMAIVNCDGVRVTRNRVENVTGNNFVSSGLNYWGVNSDGIHLVGVNNALVAHNDVTSTDDPFSYTIDENYLVFSGGVYSNIVFHANIARPTAGNTNAFPFGFRVAKDQDLINGQIRNIAHTDNVIEVRGSLGGIKYGWNNTGIRETNRFIFDALVSGNLITGAGTTPIPAGPNAGITNTSAVNRAGISFGNVEGGLVSNNRVSSHKGRAYTVSAGTRVSLENNVADGIVGDSDSVVDAGYYIDLSAGVQSDIALRGNSLTNSGVSGIVALSDSGISAVIGLDLDGNFLDDCNSDAPTTVGKAGIYIDRADRVSLIRNRVRAAGYGIYFNQVTNSTVSFNYGEQTSTNAVPFFNALAATASTSPMGELLITQNNFTGRYRVARIRNYSSPILLENVFRLIPNDHTDATAGVSIEAGSNSVWTAAFTVQYANTHLFFTNSISSGRPQNYMQAAKDSGAPSTFTVHALTNYSRFLGNVPNHFTGF